jgi:endonuclease YncB( thermonuclease family)
MAELTRGHVRCVLAGNQFDRYRRTVAKCSGPNTPDLGAEMIREGLACQWVRYSRREYDGLGRDCDRRGK